MQTVSNPIASNREFADLDPSRGGAVRPGFFHQENGAKLDRPHRSSGLPQQPELSHARENSHLIGAASASAPRRRRYHCHPNDAAPRSLLFRFLPAPPVNSSEFVHEVM